VSITFGIAHRWGAAVFALAVLVAASATAFGYQFARESHGHGEEAGMEHAEGEEAKPHGADEGHEHEEMEHAEGEEAKPHGADEGQEHDEQDGAAILASAIVIGLAGGVLSPLAGLVARRREGEAPANTAPGLGRTLSLQLAALSIGAAIIHFAVIAQHWDEWWLAAIFFIAVALFQLAWAMLVLLRPSMLVDLSGAVINALVVVTWVVSRTSGVPVGPEAGEPEPVGFPDVLATAYELLLVVLVLALVSRPQGRLPGWRAGASWLSGVIPAALAALALTILA
jgi:hypothetical protein